MRGAWIEMFSWQEMTAANRSLPVRGAWIEILTWGAKKYASESLPVRGAWIEMINSLYSLGKKSLSLPVRGAWIEILFTIISFSAPKGRSPCGERGLKYILPFPNYIATSRSPCGERGLKCPCGITIPLFSASLPVRGAWIEMFRAGCAFLCASVAPRAGSVD